MYKNVAGQKVQIFAWDSDAQAPKTGDAANIVAKISKDCGVFEVLDTATITELDSTNAPGVYYLGLSQTESNADLINIYAKSPTADITIEPVIIYTQTIMRGTDNAALDADKGDWATATGFATASDIATANAKHIAVETTIASITSADISFTLADGSTDDDAYNNMIITLKDADDGLGTRSRKVSDYVGSTKTVTLDYDAEFPLEVGDPVIIWANSYSQTAGTAAAAEIADAVWNEEISGHKTSGTTGKSLSQSGGRY